MTIAIEYKRRQRRRGLDVRHPEAGSQSVSNPVAPCLRERSSPGRERDAPRTETHPISCLDTEALRPANDRRDAPAGLDRHADTTRLREQRLEHGSRSIGVGKELA